MPGAHSFGGRTIPSELFSGIFQEVKIYVLVVLWNPIVLPFHLRRYSEVFDRMLAGAIDRFRVHDVRPMTARQMFFIDRRRYPQ
jgi:hypothetical protein